MSVDKSGFARVKQLSRQRPRATAAAGSRLALLGVAVAAVLALAGGVAQAATSAQAASSAQIGAAARSATFKNSGPGWGAWHARVSPERGKHAGNGSLTVEVKRTKGTVFAALRRPTITVKASGSRFLATARISAGSASAVGKPAAIVVRERTRSGRVVRVTTSRSVKLTRKFVAITASATAVHKGDRLEVFVIQRSAPRGDVLLADSVRLSAHKATGPTGPPDTTPPTTLNDFETGTTEGWSKDYGNGTAANDTSVAYNGTHSLALTLSGSGNVAYRSAAWPTGVTAGTQITYHVYAPGGAAITVEPYTIDGAWNYTYQNAIPAFDGIWRTITFTVPALTSGLQYLGLLVLDGQNWAGTINLDTVGYGGTVSGFSPTPSTTTPTGAPGSTPTPDGPPGAWRLAFDDEFTGSSLDTSKWSDCFPWGCQGTYSSEKQCYSPSNVVVGNNELLLAATHSSSSCNGATQPYTSGLITTYKSYQLQYGYTEVRFWNPVGQGYWPIVDLLPADLKWPPEIDLMEAGGSDPTSITMHYHYASSYYAPGWAYTGPNFSQGFHTIGVDVEPNAITWYVDGQQWARFSGAAQLGVINRPMYLALGLAIGGPYNGAPDATTPAAAYLRFDYVRSWQAG
jgi:beta-glucanase (GH16 family)